MKDETMFKMKRSASSQARKALEELQDTIPLSVIEAYRAMTYFFIDEDVIKAWAHAFNIMQDRNDTYLPKEMRREFIGDLTVQASKKFTFELDPASRLLIMGGNPMDVLPYSVVRPSSFVANFSLPGTYGCIDGVPRMGKTAFGVTLMREIHDAFHQKILTNIVIDDPPRWIIQVKKLSDLCIEMEQNNQWTCVLDETGTYVHKKRALSRTNVDFENLTRFVGKMGGRLLMITHSFEMDVPTQLQEWITERYSKFRKEIVHIRLKRTGGHLKLNQYVGNVPDSKLPEDEGGTGMHYVTEDITSLDFDISVARVLERVQDGTSVTQAVNEQLEKDAPKETKRDRVLELFAEHPDWTKKQIAKEAQCAVNYVHRVI